MKPGETGRDIICAECPKIYSENDITGHRGEEARPLIEILGRSEPATKTDRGTTTRAFKRLFGRDREADTGKFALANQRQTLVNLDRLKDWQFKCPAGHPVDGNRGQQIPVAVFGPSGASKSHFLPGLVWETSILRALGSIGVTLRPGPFTSSGLNFQMQQIYEHRQVLPPTPPEKVTGPFGYRLSVQNGNQETRHSLLLFDVGGEALSTITRIGDQAAFVLLCQALFVLIDPQDLMPTQFDDGNGLISDRQRAISAARVRDDISRIADALEEMWDGSMRDIPVPVCFVIAKSDSIDWVFDWENETKTVVGAATAGDSLHTLLVSSSNRVSGQFMQFGGALVVEEILERFNQDRIRFVAASATSEMPSFPADAGGNGRGSWQEPTPSGISLALLHVLDMLGKIHSPALDEETDDETQVATS
jgi:hypothetical protein